MTIIYKEGAKNKNADGLSRWALPNKLYMKPNSRTKFK
jgi:hypothetical protein